MPMSQKVSMLEQLRRGVLLLNPTDVSDGQLLELFLARRDEAAFEALVRRHGPMVLGVCRRVLRHWHDAEDAFQATFLVLARKAAAVTPRELVGNWLYGVACRTALKARTAAARRRVKERRAGAMAKPEAVDDGPAPDWEPLLDQELSRLPDKYRVPLVLCELQGKSRKDAARQLGLAEGTLSSRLARARRMLAKRLASRGLAMSAGSLAAGLSARGAAAAVPAPLVVSTVKAAALFAAGNATAAGVSAPVAALTEGVLKAMFLSKFKLAGELVLAICLLGTGTGLLSYHTLATEAAMSPSAHLAPVVSRRTDELRKASQVALEQSNEPAPASPEAGESNKGDKPRDKQASAKEVLTKSFQTGKAPRLIVKLQNGAIEITANTEGAIDAQVTKEAKARTPEAAQEALKSVEVKMEQEGNTVRITANTPSGIHADTKAVLRVPPGTTLDVQTVNGAVNVTGATGDGRLATTNGAIHVKDCKSTLDLKTTNGAITVMGGAGRLNTKTDNGEIDIRATKAVLTARSTNGNLHFEGALGEGQQSFHTDNGSIILSLPASARFRVEAETGNGRVSSEFSLARSAGKSRTRLSGAVGANPSTTIKLRTQNGSIMLKRLMSN